MGLGLLLPEYEDLYFYVKLETLKDKITEGISTVNIFTCICYMDYFVHLYKYAVKSK